MRLYGRNKFAASCAVSGQWVEAGAGWRTNRAGRWCTISADAAAKDRTAVVLDVPNDRRALCCYCGAVVEARAGVVQVDRSGPRDVFSVLDRDCEKVLAIKVP
jgi:hypothetical protein